MSASQPGVFSPQQFTDAGAPLAAGRLYTYAAGTTAHKTTYTDAAGLVPHTYTADGLGGSYIALNARGELAAAFYLGAGVYDIVLKRFDGSTVWTRPACGMDSAVNTLGAALAVAGGAGLLGWLQSGAGAVFRWVRDKLRENVSVKDFGAVGDGVTDDRPAIEAAINALAATGGTLRFPPGNYLLNSFSSNASLASNQGQILPLYSNLRFVFDGGAKLTLGAFFDDKNFNLFCGYNAILAANFTDLQNIHFEGGVLDFGGAASQMRGAYRLRIGIQLARITRGSVTGMQFQNGDLSNAIMAGRLTVGDDFQVTGCTFTNLVQENTVNHDFTAIYANCTNSRLLNNYFTESTVQARRVACAVELHKSYSAWVGGSVLGYTRGCFLTSMAVETSFATDQIVSGVVSSTVNAFAWVWTDTGCTLRNVLIAGNSITCSHIPGAPMAYNGNMGVIGFANEAGAGATIGIVARNNTLLIGTVVIAGRATLAWCAKTQDDVKLLDNVCTGVVDGVKVLGAATDLTLWEVRGNSFRTDSAAATDFFTFGGRNVNQCRIEGNRFDFGGAAYDMPIAFRNTGTIAATRVAGNAIVRNKPTTRDFAFPAAFAGDVSNKATYSVYGASLAYPTLGAGLAGAAPITGLAAGDARTGSNFRWRGNAPPFELALSTTTSAGDVANVKFLIFNHTAASKAASSMAGALEIEL